MNGRRRYSEDRQYAIGINIPYVPYFMYSRSNHLDMSAEPMKKQEAGKTSVKREYSQDGE